LIDYFSESCIIITALKHVVLWFQQKIENQFISEAVVQAEVLFSWSLDSLLLSGLKRKTKQKSF